MGKQKVDYTGKTYNDLTFVSQAEGSLWNCKCICGITITRSACSVISGHNKSCGCRKINDLTGKKFGRLTFLQRMKEKYQGKYLWKIQCDCGTILHKISSPIVGGYTVSCGCRKKEIMDNLGKQSVRLYEPQISSARAKWARNYPDCDFDLFLTLSQQPCHYCGRNPHRITRISRKKRGMSEHQKENGNFVYNGLDRIDSSKGHTSDNVVPCCWDCNHMKGKRTRQEFLDHIQRVHSHSLLGVVGVASGGKSPDTLLTHGPSTLHDP